MIGVRTYLSRGLLLATMASWAGVVAAQTTGAQAPQGSATATSAPSSGLEEIVVTAQKREQNLQDVPIAVTALNAEAIEKARITNITSLSGLAPNLNVEAAAGGNGIPLISIRGVAAGSGILGADNSIALYVDGVYIGDYFGSIQDVADLERVEVLRGPQGTLFGRNSTGGAINFITVGPTGKFGLRQLASFGNYGALRLKSRLDLPEWNNISAQFSYLHLEDDGDVRNLGSGTVFDYTAQSGGQIGRQQASSRLNGSRSDAVHAAVRFTPTDALQIDYKFDWLKARMHNQPRQVLGFSDGAGGAFSRLILGSQPGGYESLISLKRLSVVDNWLSQPDKVRSQGHSVTISWEASDQITIKNLASYRSVKAGPGGNQIDGAGGLFVNPSFSFLCGGAACEGDPFILLGLPGQVRDNDQWTNELQFNFDTDALSMVAGYYYYDLTAREVPPTAATVFQVAPNFEYPGPPLGNSRAKVTSHAVFAQGTLHASESLDLTAGVRSTWDRKDINEFGIQYPIFKDSRIDWLANISYTFYPGLMTYAKVSTGYQGGGVTHRFFYEPETVTSYEAGLKGDFLDRHLRINAAVFHTDYKNLQFAHFDVTLGTRTLNAGKARIRGAELETTMIPVEGLTLGASVGYTDFEFTELDPRIGDVNTFRPVLRPRWTSNLTAGYELPSFGWGGTLSFDVDAQYRSSVFLVQKPILEDPALDRATRPGSRWLLNARATLADIPLGGVEGRLSLWGRNLTNDKSLIGALDLGTVVSGAFQRPRTYGIDLEVRF